MYQIQGNFSGFFPLTDPQYRDFMFNFSSLEDAKIACAALNKLRNEIKSWIALKEFGIWDSGRNEFIFWDAKTGQWIR